MTGCFTDEMILLDLKHLLMEAKQTVPDFLRVLESDNKQFEDHGCEYTPRTENNEYNFLVSNLTMVGA